MRKLKMYHIVAKRCFAGMATHHATRRAIRVVLPTTLILAASTMHAATIAFRLGGDAAGLVDYKNNPESFPVCKSGTTYMHFDGTPPLAGNHLFDTGQALVEIGMYTVGGQYSGTEVVNRIRTYEGRGWNVFGVFLYREDWLNGTPIGDYPVDWRILSTNEIANIRNAIATASPPLQCRDTVKLIQLLGGASSASVVGGADAFPVMSEEVKNHLKLFDGLGLECHINDEKNARIGVLDAMAAISQWAADNGKQALIFMGGGPPTYEDLPASQQTYQYLWSKMLAAGVDYRADHLIYFRQGARDGKHVPESAPDTLTHQQRWVINTIATNGHTLFVGDVADRSMNAGATGVVSFIVGSVEVPVSNLVVSAVSSNQGLVSNANLIVAGRGSDRIVSITPNPSQTGLTTITLTASDGTATAASTFQLTVAAPSIHTAATGGDINNSSTWGGYVPGEGDTGIWRTGSQTITMSATNTATFSGGTFVVQAGGQFAPGIPTARLTLNNLVLDGGRIYMGNNIGLTMDLSGHQFTLISGTLKAGGSNNGRDVRFQNCTLAGGGTIDIAGTDTTGSDVEFQSTVKTLGFTGVFNVSSNGVLNLPRIPVGNASFSVSLSGSGRYWNDADVALTGLSFDGMNVAPGVYAYSDFTPAQQIFLADNGGTITVVAPGVDSDGDGFPDWAEDVAGTDRLDPSDNAFLISGGGVPVHVSGKAGRVYSLQRTDSLQPASWGTVETAGPLVSDQTIVFASGTPATNGFYRVVAELP